MGDLAPHGTTIVAANLIAAPYWVNRFACPGSAVMALELEDQNLTAVIQNGNATLGLIAEQLLNSHIFAYTSVATLPQKPMSQWLPHHIFGPVEEFGSDLVTIIGWAVASLIAVRAVALAVRAQGWSALFQPRLALLLVMAGTTLVWGFSQVTKNSYEAMHILPAWIVVLLLAGGMRRGELLGLQIRDIIASSSSIQILRRADSKDDARPNGPRRERSTTRSPCTPRTRKAVSTTARSSLPMRHVPTGW